MKRGMALKLSTKGRYGLRALIDLAIHSQEEYVTLGSIAQRQELSEGYLEQLMAKLKKAGIVKSIRGSLGGYMLAKAPQEITVGDILRALEGELSVVECSDTKGCMMYDACVTKYVWRRINDSINNVVDTMTLEEVLINSCIKE